MNSQIKSLVISIKRNACTLHVHNIGHPNTVINQRSTTCEKKTRTLNVV